MWTPDNWMVNSRQGSLGLGERWKGVEMMVGLTPYPNSLPSLGDPTRVSLNLCPLTIGCRSEETHWSHLAITQGRDCKVLPWVAPALLPNLWNVVVAVLAPLESTGFDCKTFKLKTWFKIYLKFYLKAQFSRFLLSALNSVYKLECVQTSVLVELKNFMLQI